MAGSGNEAKSLKKQKTKKAALTHHFDFLSTLEISNQLIFCMHLSEQNFHAPHQLNPQLHLYKSMNWSVSALFNVNFQNTAKTEPQEPGSLKKQKTKKAALTHHFDFLSTLEISNQLIFCMHLSEQNFHAPHQLNPQLHLYKSMNWSVSALFNVNFQNTAKTEPQEPGSFTLAI